MFAADRTISFAEETLGASIRQSINTPINPRGFEGKNLPQFTTVEEHVYYIHFISFICTK